MKIRLDDDGMFRREDGAVLVGVEGVPSWRMGEGRVLGAHLRDGSWCLSVQGSNGREWRTLEALDARGETLTWWTPET